MKNQKLKSFVSASFAIPLIIALSTSASQSADYVKGYTKGSGSQLLLANGGAGAVTFVDEAAIGGGDMNANGGNPTWGWEIGGSWVLGDKVEFTGIAMPIWANDPDTDGTNNTQNATHRIRIYSCGANDSFDGAGTDTLIDTVDVTFGLADSGIDEYYVNFDTPVVWASADSTKFYFYIQALELPSTGKAMRIKTGTANAGAAVIKNRTNGVAFNVDGSSTTLLSVAGIVNRTTWYGDNGVDGTADWDTSSSNWDVGAAMFADGNLAVFDETFDGKSSDVSLVGSLSPSAVSVVNTAGGTVPEYQFSGTGNLTGAMGLARSGNGTLKISNTGNDYTGGTLIHQGTINLGVDDALSTASILTIGGTGTSMLVLDGFDQTITGLQSVSNNTRVIENNVAGSILTVNVADTESYEYTSNFTGTASATSIAKTGLGTQIFTRGGGGYSAAILDVSAHGGSLIWNANGNSGAVTVASGATLQIGYAGTSGGVGSGAGAGSVGNANIDNDGEVAFSRSDAVSYSGVISGSGAVRLYAGTALTLGATQTYSGDTYIALGTLTAVAANQLSAASVLRIGGFSGGTSAVEISGTDQTIAGLAQNGGNTRQIQNTSGSVATLTIDVETGESHDYGANLTGTSAINIVKDGPGTQTMFRNNYTTDPGNITVNDGTLNWFVNDTYGAVAVNGNATLGLDRNGTAASFATASGTTTNYNVVITDWTGTAGADWPLITVTGDLSTAVGSTFNVIVTDGVTNFTEANKSFVIGTVGGTPTPLGTFSVDDSGFTAGTGTWSLGVSGTDLLLTYTAAADPYAAWATSKSLTAPNAGKTDDKENDGIENQLEWVLGGDPLVSDTNILPTVVKSGTNLVFTFNRGDDTIGAIDLIVQYGSDLVGWTDEPVPTSTSGIYTITDNGTTDSVVATIPVGAATKQFVRLKTISP